LLHEIDGFIGQKSETSRSFFGRQYLMIILELFSREIIGYSPNARWSPLSTWPSSIADHRKTLFCIQIEGFNMPVKHSGSGSNFQKKKACFSFIDKMNYFVQLKTERSPEKLDFTEAHKSKNWTK